ncbi:MAG: electron transfer flavoprotein beta subunit/FixA family protein [Bdellovibrionales bacterium]
MEIFVCVKQVPDTETKIKVTGNSLDFAGTKWILNPYDEFAIEEALKLKTQVAGSTVTVVSVGPKQSVSETLRTALAMGADEAMVIDAPENIDNLTAARALAAAIKPKAPKIIFSGKAAIDDNSMAVTQMLAEELGYTHATVVSKFEWGADKVTVEREAEGGAKETLELTLPAVIGANKGLNTPRYASLPGIMKAKKKTLQESSLSALSISPEDQRVSYSSFQLPPDRPACKILSGDSAAQSAELVKLLREEAKVV